MHGLLHPQWNELNKSGLAPNLDEGFKQARAIYGEDLISILAKIVDSDMPARSFVEVSLLARHDTNPLDMIIKLELGGLPWSNHLYSQEKDCAVDLVIKCVQYTNQAGMWRSNVFTAEGKQLEKIRLPKE